MDKFEYIVRTLSRTKRKNYENYVINRIWNKLDDLDIKPVSQQYVDRKNGRYALIDLYFPQFNIGIECDEFHHIQEAGESGFTSDELRTEDIISAVEDYEEIRIPIYDGPNIFRKLEDVNMDIDKVVATIKERKETSTDFEAWTNEPDLSKAKRQGLITTSDRFFFKTNGEIRDFFGLGAESIQRSYYIINKETGDHLWLPHLAIENNGETKAATTAGHINLYEDAETILEHVHYDESVDAEKIKQENESTEDFKRITFVKSRDDLGFDGFRFIGVFQKTGDVVEKEINGQKLPFRVYKKVSDKISSSL